MSRGGESAFALRLLQYCELRKRGHTSGGRPRHAIHELLERPDAIHIAVGSMAVLMHLLPDRCPPILLECQPGRDLDVFVKRGSDGLGDADHCENGRRVATSHHGTW